MLPSDRPTTEMSLGRTLIFAAKLYLRGFPQFFSPTLILSVIMFGLLTLVLIHAVNVVEGNPTFYDSAMGMISQFFMISSYLLVLSILYLVGASLVTGYNLIVGDDIVNGKFSDYQRSLRSSRSAYTRTLLLFLTIYFGILAGSLILWIPGVLAAIILPMSLPSHCIEGSDALNSILRGYRLVEGRWVKTLLLFILDASIAGIVFLLVCFILITTTFTLIGVQGYLVTLLIVMMNAAISYALIEPFLYLTLLSHYYSMYARIGPSLDY